MNGQRWVRQGLTAAGLKLFGFFFSRIIQRRMVLLVDFFAHSNGILFKMDARVMTRDLQRQQQQQQQQRRQLQ